MSDVEFRERRNQPILQNHLLSPEGRWAIALGMVALMIGLGAAAAGAYLGLGTTGRMVPLPGGLAAANAGTVAIIMSASGTVTMLLGAVSIYKAYDI